MKLKENKKWIFLFSLLIVFVNGLKWKALNSNQSWTEIHSYPFEGNKQPLPFPFRSQLLPIHFLRQGENTITSCEFTDPSIDVNKILFFLLSSKNKTILVEWKSSTCWGWKQMFN